MSSERAPVIVLRWDGYTGALEKQTDLEVRGLRDELEAIGATDNPRAACDVLLRILPPDGGKHTARAAQPRRSSGAKSGAAGLVRNSPEAGPDGVTLNSPPPMHASNSSASTPTPGC
jgi:hypothetical protein